MNLLKIFAKTLASNLLILFHIILFLCGCIGLVFALGYYPFTTITTILLLLTGLQVAVEVDSL